MSRSLTLEKAYTLQATLEEEYCKACKAKLHAQASHLREELEDLARQYGL